MPAAALTSERELALAAASVILVLFGLGGLEAFARSRPGQADPDAEAINDQHVYSEAYGWRPSPGAWVEDGGQRITVNRWGFRGAEVPLARTPGRRRVLVLGDSIAFGLRVDDAQTFAARLNDERTEVLNLAVQGFGPDQSLLRLEAEGLAWRPDLVVMAICLDNDFADVMLPVFLYDGQHRKPFFRLEEGRLVLHDRHLRLSLRQRLGVSLVRNSAAARWLLSPVLVPPVREKSWHERKHKALRPARDSRALTLELLSRMRDDVAEQGARLLVLLFPSRDSWQPNGWSRSLLGSPKLAGVEVVEMARVFQQRGLAFDDVAFDGIGHLTPLGHRVAAELVAGKIAAAR